MRLAITERTVGDVTILDLRARVLMLDPPFRDTIARLAHDGREKIVLNMEGVAYVDSSGLGMLHAAWMSLRNNGGIVVCCGFQRRVSRLFEITRSYTVITAFASEEEALKYLHSETFHF